MNFQETTDEFFIRACQEYRDALVQASLGPVTDNSEYLAARERIERKLRSMRPRVDDEPATPGAPLAMPKLAIPSSPEPADAWESQHNDADWHVRALITFGKIVGEPISSAAMNEAISVARTALLGEALIASKMAIVSELVKMGDFERALNLSSLGEDEFDESRLRCLAVGGLIERDRLEEALEVAATIRDPFWNGNAGYRIVEGLAFAGRNAEAMDLAESYVEDSKPIALAAAAAGFARSGRFDDAGEVGARIDHIYWFEQAMADTAAALFAAGDESEALEMARSLTDSHLKSVTEAKIAEIAFQAGHEDLGISIALSVEDDCTRVELFVKLSSFKEDELSMDLLLSAYQEARDSTELMVYNSSAQLIAKGFAKRGEWEHAWSVVNTIDHNYAQSLAAAELITLDPSFLLSDTQEVWENILARFCGRRRTDMILATPVLAAILAKSTGPHAGLALFEVLREVRTEWP